MAGWTQQLVDTLAPSHVRYSHIIAMTMLLLQLRTGRLWYDPQVTRCVCVCAMSSLLDMGHC